MTHGRTARDYVDTTQPNGRPPFNWRPVIWFAALLAFIVIFFG